MRKFRFLRTLVRSCLWLPIAVLAAASAHAAPWTTRIESTTLVGNFFFWPVASGGNYWLGAVTYDGDSVLVRIVSATGAASTTPLGVEPQQLVSASDGGVYATDDRQVFRIAPDGSIRWVSAVADGANNAVLLPFPSGDLIVARRNVAGTFAGTARIARLRGADGSLQWSLALPLAANECANVIPLLLGDRVVLPCWRSASAGYRLRVFDAATGAALPDLVPAFQGRQPSVQSVGGDGTSLFAIVFDESTARLLRVDPATGATRWAIDASSSSAVTPMGAGFLRVQLDSGPAIVRTVDGGITWRPGAGELVPDGTGRAYVRREVDSSNDLEQLSLVDLANGRVIWTDPEPFAIPYAGEVDLDAADATGYTVGRRTFDRQMLELLNWSASGTRRAAVVPVLPSTRPPVVEQSGNDIVVLRALPDAAASRTVVQLVDATTGAARWQSVVQEDTRIELLPAGVCFSGNGTIVATSGGFNDDFYDPSGTTRIVAFDRATGAERWHIDRSNGSELSAIGAPSCDGDGRVYVRVSSRNEGQQGTTTRLLGIDAATGAVNWSTSPVADLAAVEPYASNPTARGFLATRSNGASRYDLQLLDGATGAARWTTPLLDALSPMTATRLRDGDPVVYSQAGSVTAEQDLLLRRYDAASGSVRWGRRLDGPYGGRQVVRNISRGPDDELYVASRNFEVSTASARGALARVDGETGNVHWSVELPRPPYHYVYPGNPRVVPGTDTLLVRHILENLDTALPLRYELLSLDRATGELRNGRLLGPGSQSSAFDVGAWAGNVAVIGVDANGEMLTQRQEAGAGVRPATVLERGPALASRTGNGSVTLRLGALTGTNPQRATFRIEASFQGEAAVTGAQLRTLFPDDVVIDSWQCRIEGTGTCGASAQLRQRRQSLDLAPGSRAVIEGTFQVAFPWVVTPSPFHAWFDLPSTAGETTLVDNVATVPVELGTPLDLVADARFSGSWFDPARSGEGWILEMLPDGTVLMFWFTYPPNGAAGDQQWLIAQNGRVQGSRIVFDETYVTSGTRFGSGFDAANVRLQRWGNITLTFTDCNTGRLSYLGRAPFANGSRTITRLTSLAGVECSGPSSPPNAIRSGAWYDTQRAGEGWIVEALPDGRANVYWFTYSPDGNQAWTFGTGTLVGDRLRIDDMRRPRGTRFGTGFNPANVNVAPWGTLQIDFSGCNGGTLSYTSSEAGYDPATRNITRLTRIAGTNCQ